MEFKNLGKKNLELNTFGKKNISLKYKKKSKTFCNNKRFLGKKECDRS